MQPYGGTEIQFEPERRLGNRPVRRDARRVLQGHGNGAGRADPSRGHTGLPDRNGPHLPGATAG